MCLDSGPQGRQVARGARLQQSLVEATEPFSDSDELSNHLAFFHQALADPELYSLARDQAAAFRRAIRLLLKEAVEAGDIRSCDTNRLAQLVQSIFSGSIITWASFRVDNLSDGVRRDLETALEPLILKDRDER